MKSKGIVSKVGQGLAAPMLGMVIGLATSQALASPSGPEVLRDKCQACHMPKEDGGLARISDARRTPEGWDMTVARMMYAHGVRLTAQERQAVVKYLSDTQGLAPEESAGYRYALERRPSVVERFDNQKVGETCARCHSYARVALQRRTEEDWRKLAHFHVGQFPVIEIQASGRDRDWWDHASKDVPAILGKEKALNSAAWNEWRGRKPTDAAGTWRVAGHRPGSGDYDGKATIKALGEDKYDIAMEVVYDDGRVEKSSGIASLFTGHEWRGSLTQDGVDVRQVFGLAKDGNHFNGRWFLANQESIGADVVAVRDAGQAEILAVRPAMIKAGQRQQLTISGVGLSGDVDLGGVTVTKVVSKSPDKIVLEVEAKAGAAEGSVPVKVGAASLPNALAVYKKIDYVVVAPGSPMARVGGNGGRRPKVPVQLEALAYSAGPDGKQGTADDLLLGAVPAAWKVGNLNKGAAAMQDAKYAGTIDRSGLFSPADAGPNPKRRYGTNNAGELQAVATVKDGGREVTGSAPLVVTVQRWNDPPIY